MIEIPQIVLAAGASRRLGRPKQLLPWKGKTLIEHQIQTLLALKQKVVVVLGSNFEEIYPQIEHYPISIVRNENWEKGMGSSLSFGVKFAVEKFPESAGFLISLVDQPLIDTSHYLSMIASFAPNKIIVSKSLETEMVWKGPPVLFDAGFAVDLSQLTGEEGAKSVLQKYSNSIDYIESKQVGMDIDTMAMYQNLLSLQS